MSFFQSARTFNLVPEHVAVGVVSRDESDGVTDRIRFHDFGIGTLTVIGAKLRSEATTKHKT